MKRPDGPERVRFLSEWLFSTAHERETILTTGNSLGEKTMDESRIWEESEYRPLQALYVGRDLINNLILCESRQGQVSLHNRRGP